MKIAKDLMTSSLFSIQSGCPLSKVVADFAQHDVTCAPVVTPMGELLGVVTDMNLVQAFLRHRLNRDNTDKMIHHKEVIQDAFFVHEKDSISEVIKTMIRSPYRRVLVKNNMGNLTGIISPKDILHFLTGEQHKSQRLELELEEYQKKVSELTHQLEDITYIMEKYKNLYDDSPTMMHSVDSEGKIVMANKKMHQVLRYEPEEMIGKHFLSIYAKPVHSMAIQGLGEIMNQAVTKSTYTTMVTKDGNKLRIDITSSALRDRYGKFIGTISASRVVDSDTLLRALHGVFKSQDIPDDEVNKLFGDHEED